METTQDLICLIQQQNKSNCWQELFYLKKILLVLFLDRLPTRYCKSLAYYDNLTAFRLDTDVKRPLDLDTDPLAINKSHDMPLKKAQ